ALPESCRIYPGTATWAQHFTSRSTCTSLSRQTSELSTPFEYLTVAGVRLPLPFTTRMTVVRLSNGDLFLHSPTKFDRKLADELQRLGSVRHLISPNQFHYAHIGEWLKAFPDAVGWA